MAITAAQLVAQVSVQGADKAKSDLQGVGGFVSSLGGGIKSALGGALNIASGLAVQGLSMLKDQLVDSIKLAEQHQSVMAQTAQAIKSTGDASGMTAQSVGDLAEKFSQMTPFSEDAIQSGENLMLTFTGIGKQVFPQATQAMLDLSQATGQSMTSSAMQLGKALNDPLTGMNALARVGVSFSAQEKEQIKTMMAHNDVIGAQKIMLGELSKEFGGSAAAAGKTYAGQMAILGNQFDDIKIKIGTALLPILSQLMSTVETNVLPAVIQFSNWFSAVGAPAIAKFAGQVEPLIAQVIKLVVQFVQWSVQSGVISNAIGAITTFVQQLFGALSQNSALTEIQHIFQQIGSYLSATFQPVLQQLQTTWQTQLLPAVQQLLPALKPIAEFIGGVLVVALGLLIGVITGVIRAFAAFLAGAIQVVGGIVQVFTGMVQIIGGYLQLLYDLFHGNFNKIGSDLGGILSGYLNIFRGFGNIFMGLFGAMFNSAIGLVQGFVDGIIGYFQNLFDALVGHSIIPDMINGIISWLAQLPSRGLAAIASFAGQVISFFANLANQALTWGADMIDNFINGLAGAAGGLITEAQNIAANIASILHFSKPDIGPLASADQWMPDFMSLLADGMNSNLDKVKNASLNVASSISVSTNPSSFPASGGLQGLQVLPSGGQAAQSNQIIVQPAPVYLDGRVLANGLMPHIVDTIRSNTGTKNF